MSCHVGTNTSKTVIMLCQCAELILQVLVSKTVIMLCECAELIRHVMSVLTLVLVRL